MPYCTECGSKMPDDEQFCRQCGTKLRTWVTKPAPGQEPEPVPIAQSSDGQVKVSSVDNEGHTEYLTFGETWTMTGSGLVTGIEEGVRWIPDVALQCPGAEDFVGHFLRLTPSADGKTMTLSPNPNQPTPPSGTYENASLGMMTIKDDVQEVLDIPIKLIVGA